MSKIRLLAVVAVCSLLPLPSYGQQVVDGSASVLGDDDLAQLLSALPGFLLDPSSAQLSKLHKDPDNGDYICGFFNAKNSFGGYVGMQPFRYGLKNKMLITKMNTPC